MTADVSQPGIEPYSLELHNPSTGFVPRHVLTAVPKLLSVMAVTAAAPEIVLKRMPAERRLLSAVPTDPPERLMPRANTRSLLSST